MTMIMLSFLSIQTIALFLMDLIPDDISYGTNVWDDESEVEEATSSGQPQHAE